MSSVEVLEVPDKSENDKKSYRVIRLTNGLKAMLISAPSKKDCDSEQSTKVKSANLIDIEQKSCKTNSKQAACSLCVEVGSFSNPHDIQGLAHFLEHMVLMGSEKYPIENSFEQFMQKSGGFSNAETDFDETLFYFRVREEFLDEAIDRFSQFFKAPLLLKDGMARERQAVESEFSSKKNGELIRRGHLLAMLGQSNHPSTTFACGNQKTLQENITDDVLYQQVHDFRKRHYSAHRMYVCVQSKLPLDDLQEMVERHFSTVPSNNLPGNDFSAFTHENAFQSRFYEKVLFVEPINNLTKIDITWCMEPMIQKFKCKPDLYLGHILGYEGTGSLISYLRKRLWAVDLIAGTDTSGMGSTNLFSLFTISIHLTKIGFEHLDDVLEAVFSYLIVLKAAGPKQYIFDEMQTIHASSFRFASEQHALKNVHRCVINLENYPTKYVLTGGALLFEYDVNEIQKFIDQINTRTFNVMITSAKRYNEHVNFESTEPWFGTKFTELDMPPKWISLWENATPNPEFFMHEPNPYITDDFTIFYNNAHPVPKSPTKILDNDLCELWFRQDDKFLLPDARCVFYFRSSAVKQSIENMISMTLLSKLLQYQFVEKLYPARVAGMGYGSSLSDMGIIFHMYGYNQKLHLVIDEIIRCLKSLADDCTEQQFDTFVQETHNSYENVFIQPKPLATHLCFNILQNYHKPLFEKNKHLRTITFAGFQQFCRDFCAEMHIKALMQGNLTEDRALNIMNNVVDALKFQKIENLSLIEIHTFKLPIGSNYLRCQSFNPKDENTLTMNYYQIGPLSYRTMALIDLLALIVHEPLFNKLRTNEQLAYDVSINKHLLYGIVGYSIKLHSQETKFSAEYVDERIENFRHEILSLIENMSEKDFNEIKASIVKNKLSEDNKLSEEVNRNWSEIDSNYYDFNRFEKDVEALSTITKNHVLEFYRNHYGENQRKLSVQVIGHVKPIEHHENQVDSNEDLETRRRRFDSLTYVNFTGPPKGNSITDFMQFRNSLEVYPLSDPN